MRDELSGYKEYDTSKTGKPSDGPTKEHGFLHHLWASVASTVLLCIICCAIYPAIVWGIAQAVFPAKANGSLVKKDGTYTTDDKEAVGSAILGQNFSDAKYFHPRPSSAGNGYDAANSSGSNLGPLSKKLLYGTTKDSAFTVIAHDDAHADGAQAGRTEGTVVSASKTKITIARPASVPAAATPPSTQPATRPATFDLDPAVAVAAQGRTLKETTPAVGANVELKFTSATQPTVVAVTVIDNVAEGVVSAVDTTAGKITLPGDKGSTDYALGNNALVIFNGKADAKLADIPVGAHVRILTATVVDFDGVADRVVHYCEDNTIEYTSSIPLDKLKDADGIDDVKLINEFNGSATDAGAGTITPKTPIPADAVTGSGSGLDPHISPDNAALQKARVAKARNTTEANVQKLIDANTDKPDLGILGDAGVNVLMLNIALDKDYPVAPPAAPATVPATPASQPAK